MLTFNAEKGQNINISIDKESILTMEADKMASFRLIYIALGLSSKESCTDPAFPFESQDQCLAACPSNSYGYGYPNGGHACLICSEKLNLILRNGQCICKDGYLMEQKECVAQSQPQPASAASV